MGRGGSQPARPARWLTLRPVDWVADDGARIGYAVTGTGPPLVLVHGITESHRAWDPILEQLADRWRVVAVDLRGHGGSERRAPYDPATLASDVRAVVRGLALEAPLMVGHSLGGVVVSVYAGAGYPARGVVNVDQPLALGAFKEALEPLAPMLKGDAETFAAAVATVFAVLDGPLPASERARLDACSSPEQDVVLGIWGTVLDTPADELDALSATLLTGVRVPYLSLHGNDPGPDYARWLQASVPDAIVEVWPDTGHYPHLVDPARFVARLVAFDASIST